MGLDAYVYAIKNKPKTNADFIDDEPGNELFYWRKNYKLHKWMCDLYQLKGGKDKNCNCFVLSLSLEDILNLKQIISDDDLKFIDIAKNALNKGLYLYYETSW